MKKLKVFFISCIMVLTVLSTNVTQSNAAGLTVSASSSSVSVGSKVTITVRVSGNVFVEGLSISCSGGQVTSLSRSSLDRGESATATFTLTSSSGGSVTVTGNAADYDQEIEYAATGSCVIKVKSSSSSGSSSGSTSRPSQEPQEDTRSKNNNLSQLTINQGTLEPKFSAGTTKYSVSLAADVTEITVNAKADDSKAKVSGTGKHTLKAGKNEISVVCTSEYGTKKEYVIVATVDEKPLVYLDYMGKQLGVVRNLDGIKIPEGFKETTIKVNGNDTLAWANETMNKTILYLMNDANEKNFYIYEDEKVTTILKPLTLSGINLYVTDIDEKLQTRIGMKYTEVEVDGQTLNGWTFDEKSFENYVLIYVMDTDGNMRYYQYEKTSQTLQPYSDAAPVTFETYEKSLSDANTQKYIFMGLSGVLGIVVIAGIVYYLKKLKKS